MDKILQSLQGKAFHLSMAMYKFLFNKYTELIDKPIPDINKDLFHPEIIRQIIDHHRKQFHTDEYTNSRIFNPTTGTIDHLHAEITSSTAVRLGIKNGYSGYALELLRTAGHFHDSDRSFPLTMVGGEEEARHDAEAYREYKKVHAANSCNRAADLIKKAAASGYYSPGGFLVDLSYLILRHEIGGQKENSKNCLLPSKVEPDLNLNYLVDIVTDADSISYFDANILTNWEECGKDKTLLGNKVHFMYDRMSVHSQNELRETIILSDSHILGSPSADPDIHAIWNILREICI
jgi:hypothetical protein